jgi:O-antigen/teichoic acid export membrane protein
VQLRSTNTQPRGESITLKASAQQEFDISRLQKIRDFFDDTTLNLVRNGLALWGGQLANFSVGFLSLLIYGGLFAKPEIAVISLFEMVVALFLSLGFTWSAIALVRFGEGEYVREGTTAYTSSLRLSLTAPILAVLAIAILLFQDSLLAYIGTADRSIIAFLVVDLFLVVAREHFVYLFNARERQRVNALIYFGMSIGKLSVLLLLWSQPGEVSAESYVKLLVGVDALALLVHAMLLDRPFIWPLTRPRSADFFQMLRFVLPQIYGFAALFVINWIDAYFIRLYLTPEDLGGYQFVYSLFTRAAALAFIINTIFFPRIMDWDRSNPISTLRYLKRTPSIVICIMGVIAPAIILSVDPIFSYFFEAKFADVYDSFYLLLAALPWVYLSYVYVPVLNARDRVGRVQFGNAAAAVINIAVDAALIPRIGVVGAALGTLLAFQARSLILMAGAHQMLEVRYRALFVGTVACSIAGICYVIWISST